MQSLKNNYEQSQLQKYGVVVDGQVIDAHDVEGYRSGFYFVANIEYQYANQTYQQQVKTSTYVYKYNDHLKILCSSHEPELFVIVSRKSGLNIKY